MKRDISLDICKGLLMFGVVWGHAITVLLAGHTNNIGIHLIMRTYDMPLFMMISGYLLAAGLERKSINVMFIDKITTILIPTILWSLIASRGKSIWNYYFCHSVFCSSVIVMFACLPIIKKIRNAFLCVIAIVLQFLPFDFNMSYLYPFFILGGILNSKLMTKMKSGGVFPFLFVVCLCFWKQDYTIWSTGEIISQYDMVSICIVAFRFFIGYCGCFTFMVFIKCIMKTFYNPKFFIFSMIQNCGKESLAIYMLQHIVLFGVTTKIMSFLICYSHFNPLTENELLLGYVIAPIYSIILIYLMLTFVNAMKKNKYTKWMFGFKVTQP